MKSKYAFFLVATGIVFFFGFFEATNDYVDLMYLEIKENIHYAYLPMLKYNLLNWVAWFIASLLLINEINLSQVINLDRRKVTILVFRVIAVLLLAVFIATVRFQISVGDLTVERFTSVYVHILGTNFYKYLLSTVFLIGGTLIYEFKLNYKNLNGTIDVLKQERDRITKTLEETSFQLGDDSLSVRVGTKIKLVPIDQITWIEADDYCVKVHTDQKSYSMRETMKSLEKKLLLKGFIRIHRGAIINLSYLDSMSKEGNHMFVNLKNGQQIGISKTRVPNLKKVLEAS